ncbi:MAG: hypothetical protein JWR51_3448 [Devosia sp.]|uniref:hypothetical protein n=1 Tax=Devosia sp. TaxID=1871048 RepID=UPI002614787A|nr:hypothetical protein [Devosia sp.]MDB5530345.1 hypothetical protein [Devosia sp.]
MRAVIFGLAAILAVTGGAAARDCSGQGSARYLSVVDWGFSSGGKSQVDLSYRLDDEKIATQLQGHVYFQIAPDEVLADAAIDLANVAGVPNNGVEPVALSKDAVRRLARADHDAVSVFVCTNYLEYLDGSGLIID